MVPVVLDGVQPSGGGIWGSVGDDEVPSRTSGGAREGAGGGTPMTSPLTSLNKIKGQI